MSVDIHDTFGEYLVHIFVPRGAVNPLSGAGFIGGMVTAMCVENLPLSART